MNDELSKLRDLRQVQKQIEDTQKAIIINYKIFDDMITNKFDLTLELLTAVSEDRGTMRAFNSDSNSKLKELIGILLAFQNEISKSEFNQDLLKSLKNQEMQLKNDLGIK